MRCSTSTVFIVMVDSGFFIMSFMASTCFFYHSFAMWPFLPQYKHFIFFLLLEESPKSFVLPFPFALPTYALSLLLCTFNHISSSIIIKLNSSKLRGVGLTIVIKVMMNPSNFEGNAHMKLHYKYSNLSAIPIVSIYFIYR